jgi:hypothetical protein
VSPSGAEIFDGSNVSATAISLCHLSIQPLMKKPRLLKQPGLIMREISRLVTLPSPL